MNVTIGDALFTQGQQKLLALFWGLPDTTFYLNEVVRLTDMGRGATSRELNKLTAAGLLLISKQGNQNHYKANAEAVIFAELCSIVKKTFGVAEVIKEALGSLLPTLHSAFIYGSVAKGTHHLNSDVDVMLVGDNISYSEVMGLLEPAEAQLQRRVNPTIYSVEEFKQRVNDKQHFLHSVTSQTTIDLLTE